MSDITTHFYMFNRNPYIPHIRARRVVHGFPDEGEGVKYNHTNRCAAIGVINTVTEIGRTALFPVLAELLAPCNGGAYNTTYNQHDVLPRTLLIWEKLDRDGSVSHNYATHVVHFAIDTEAPYSAIHLALILIHLATQGSYAGPTTTERTTLPHPRLVDLMYSLTPNAVYGSAYFTGLDSSYEHAMIFSDANPFYSFYIRDITCPITTLPEEDRTIARTDIVLSCYQTVTALALH
ncbi:hypothetical protein C2E23DRAFT_863607 [Lenzites betulinus]|nr:hypothetical protein C2E23DRAFT_863607 [Lenzites betulinus]